MTWSRYQNMSAPILMPLPAGEEPERAARKEQIFRVMAMPSCAIGKTASEASVDVPTSERSKLFQILREMAAGQAAHRLAEQLCATVGGLTGGQIASLMRLDRDGQPHVLGVLGAGADFAGALEELALAASGNAPLFASGEGAAVLVEDAHQDPRWTTRRAFTRADQPRRWWLFPVRHSERIGGWLVICAAAPGLPSEVQMQLVEEAVVVAGNILQRLDMQEAQEAAQRRHAERAQRLAGFNAMLAQVNQLAASRPDRTTLYDGICRIAVAQAGLRLVWISAPDRAGVMRPLAAAGAVGFLDGVFASINPSAPEGRALSGTAWREVRTVLRQQLTAAADPVPWVESGRRFGLGAGAALPLLLRGEPQAVLHVSVAEDGVLDAELVGLLEELAVDVGRALEAIDQQQHLGRVEALHTALLQQGEMLLRARSDAEMLHWTCTHLAAGALFSVAWIARPDAMGGMCALAAAGLGVSQLHEPQFALDDTPPSLVVRCWREARTVVSNDMQRDPDLASYRHLMERTGWRAAAVVPIRRNGALFAVLAIGSLKPNLFSPDVLELCERIVALLSRGLDEFDRKQRLEQERHQQFHLARHDALTGLPNRREFEEHLARALASARQRATPLAVCMLDFDDFKPINDRYGHPAGDAVLCQAGQRLREALRHNDVVARLGGDEFALAIDDLNSLGALPELFDRISEAMAAPFDTGDGLVRLGLSAGVAVFPEDGDDPDLLLRRADAALYAAKTGKAARTSNWQRWDDETVRPVAPTSGIDDPYGPEAKRLLAATQGIWPVVAAEFVNEFYASLGGQKLATRAIAALSPDELARLKLNQAAHLSRLMTAATDRNTVHRTARALGHVHALAGVDSALMAQAFGLYRTLLAKHLAIQPLRASERQNLMTMALARLQDDNAEQMEAGAATVATYLGALQPPPRLTDLPWVDAVQALLDAVAGLPGIVSVRLLQPDATGILQTLASSSTAGLPFGGLAISPGASPTIDRTRREGQGLLSAAWHGDAIVSTANYQTDPRTAPWHDAAGHFGVRSAAALPVHDLDNRPVALLILFGAFPNQFEAAWVRHVCANLARELAMVWRGHEDAAARVVIPEKTAVAWRRRLFAGGLVMHYQPIIDLRTGKPTQVEALARLMLEDGQIVMPRQFLPILNMRDLDALFRLGLDQALGHIARWDAAGLSLAIAVNLAPSTLTQPDTPFWVSEALQQARVAPERLSLEIAEDRPFSDSTGAAIAALRSLGVKVVMDDLGAGYGSLQRLRSLTFHGAKLGQNLIEDVRSAPVQALSLMGALVQLGHDLDVEMVLEGLETEDLVEAAVILGADAGQGFALGRPMPAEAMMDWSRKFAWTANRQAPRTALGALATAWQSLHRGGDHQGPIETCPVTRFLEQRGELGGPLDAAHQALHRVTAKERLGHPYRDAVRQFQQDLTRTVTALV